MIFFLRPVQILQHNRNFFAHRLPDFRLRCEAIKFLFFMCFANGISVAIMIFNFFYTNVEKSNVKSWISDLMNGNKPAHLKHCEHFFWKIPFFTSSDFLVIPNTLERAENPVNSSLLLIYKLFLDRVVESLLLVENRRPKVSHEP